MGDRTRGWKPRDLGFREPGWLFHAEIYGTICLDGDANGVFFSCYPEPSQAEPSACFRCIDEAVEFMARKNQEAVH